MSIYVPHCWVILKVNDGLYKILASWYGGYLGSNSWKLSSGITKVEADPDTWQVHNHSGSIYVLGKKAHGMSMFTHSVLNSFQKQAPQITLLSEEEAKELLTSKEQV